MKTIKFLMIILMMCFNFMAIGQDCKYERNEKDKFTGKVVRETKMAPVYANKLDPQSKSMFFIFLQVDSINYLSVSKWYSDIISVSKGDKLMMIFQDGESVSLECLKYSIADSYSGKWNINIDYYIPKEILKSLQTKNITDIRIYTTTGYFEESVLIKQSEKIKVLANCVN